MRRGVQFAIERAVEFAGYWDTGLATPLEAIPELLAVLEARPDLDRVFRSRVKLPGRQVKRRASATIWAEVRNRGVSYAPNEDL